MIHPNRGFTGGNNAVIRPALESDDPPEYVLLLNADTIVQEHALDALVSFMDAHPEAGIAGSMLISPDGTVEARRSASRGSPPSWTGACGWASSRSCSRPGAWTSPSRGGPFRAGWVSGASLILRRAVLEQVGLLDEGLYTYFDDPDICLRAARAGWETWYVPESRVIHLGGATTGLSGNRAAEAPPGLLAPGAAPVLPEEPRGLVHGAGRRGVHPRLRGLAAAAAAPAQAGHRPAPYADRLDPPQRLLRRLKVPVVENPALREVAMQSSSRARRNPGPRTAGIMPPRREPRKIAPT